MKKMLAVLFCLGLSLEILAAVPAVTPVPQSESSGNWWYKRFLEKSAYLQENGTPTLLVGDSITELWEVEGRGLTSLRSYLQKAPYNAYVVGYSGDRTEHVIWRMENGELTGYEPKVIVLMIGTNNTWHREEKEEPPCDTVMGIRAILDVFNRKAPNAKIVLCAILPCGREVSDPRRARNAIVNDAIRGLCDGEKIIWCEINNQVMTPEGYYGEDFSYDGVHLDANGYKVWAKNLLKILDTILKPDETPDLQRPESRNGEPWWYERFYEIRRDAYSVRSMRPNITFFGDDLAEAWKSEGKDAIANNFGTRTYLNAGISGDAMPQLTWRAQYGGISTFRTYHLVIHAGLLNEDSPVEEYMAAYKNLLALCKAAQKSAKYFLMALPPRGEGQEDPQMQRVNLINQEIAKLADGETYFYIDCNEQLLDAAGFIKPEMSDDHIHYKAPAYEIWAKALAEIIMK